MPVIALIFDLLAAGNYFFQLSYTSDFVHIVGLIFQVLITIFLLFLTFAYRGKRHSGYSPEGYRYFSIRYAIIVISFLLNGILLFLYILDFLGINNLIFSGF